MREMRRRRAKRAIKLDMFRCVRKMVFTANDVRNLHLDGVDHTHERKNPRAVGPPDCHVGMRARICKIKIDFPADDVIDKHMLARRSESQRPRIFENVPTILKFLQIAFVNLRSLTLKIRSQISAGVWTLVPIEAEPLQTFVNRRHRFLGVASPVGVLDAQNEFATVTSCEEPIKKRCARATDMEITSRRRSETDADFGIH